MADLLSDDEKAKAKAEGGHKQLDLGDASDDTIARAQEQIARIVRKEAKGFFMVSVQNDEEENVQGMMGIHETNRLHVLEVVQEMLHMDDPALLKYIVLKMKIASGEIDPKEN
jgi:hypothetical protein